MPELHKLLFSLWWVLKWTLWKQNELRVGILFLYIEAHKTKKCLSVKLDHYSSMVYESYVAEYDGFVVNVEKELNQHH
jgi:hypothetical protein